MKIKYHENSIETPVTEELIWECITIFLQTLPISALWLECDIIDIGEQGIIFNRNNCMSFKEKEVRNLESYNIPRNIGTVVFDSDDIDKIQELNKLIKDITSL